LQIFQITTKYSVLLYLNSFLIFSPCR